MGGTRGIVADSSVLINLCHIDRLDLLVANPTFAARVTRLVIVEITRSEQKRMIQAAISRGQLTVVDLTTPADLTELAKHRVRFGAGEASCLTAALLKGWPIACDETRAFRSVAQRLLGPNRYLGTAELILDGIRQGRLSVEQADNYKAILATNQFEMPFGSFADLL